MTILLVAAVAGCRKYTQVGPPTNKLTGNNVYTSDATAIAAVTGIYTLMSASTTGAGTVPSLSLFPGLSADEFTLWSGLTDLNTNAYYKNNLFTNPTTAYGSDYWGTFYNFIFRCNDAITGLKSSSGLTPSIKQQLLGEVIFLRAFFYFYLVNLYGDAPIALTTDPNTNSNLARSSKPAVYQQILSDLHQAQQLLSPNYLDGTILKITGDRVRPSRWAATALLARTQLYNNNPSGADSAATAILNNTGTFSISTINNAFLRSSLGNNEAIWQLQPVGSGTVSNTYDAYVFTMSSTGPGQKGNYGAYLSNSLLSSFEPGDLRKANWVSSVVSSGITYYFPFKYKVGPNNPNSPANPPVTEHLMLLRLGEQYLIRAEARAMENNTAGAQADLNVIRTRAGLPNTTASTQAQLLIAILHERQVELFAELGHRWLDLKRTNNIDAVMQIATPQKTNGSGTWNSYQQWYPLPYSDIQLNPSVKQNAGY